MDIGVPREIKSGEARVGLTAAATRSLVERGHRLLIQCDAGQQVGSADCDYRAAGAELTEDSAAIYRCALIVKVKELQPSEYPLLRAGSVLFGFQQLAPSPTLLNAVLAS